MDNIDENIVNLVQVLNSFKSVQTIGSCGGHLHPKEGQWEKGTWYLKFEIDETPEGWRTLEFLAWAINQEYDDDLTVFFIPKANPPWLNKPHKTLCWVIEGYNGQDPNALAEFLALAKSDFFEIDAENI
ncbi:hypothetical protein [Paenibacillus gansuensis]|uniref:Phage ABA sandwich domain-containing protein n=1 Tax=Paenibacillus gansuensis TaxID=306542 RepID=A0ABW5PH94_9BACL